MAGRRALYNFVKGRLQTAVRIADNLGLKKAAVAESTLLSEVPSFKRLELGSGVKVSVAVLYVDMRGSTSRALRIGPRDTFLTMHAFLPAMAYLVNDYGGYIVGFRGDGLFAAFGLNGDGSTDGQHYWNALRRSCKCGSAMIETVKTIVDPVLCNAGVDGEVSIGVGIDFGEIVITRIGLERTFEITAYGNASQYGCETERQSNRCYLAHAQSPQ